MAKARLKTVFDRVADGNLFAQYREAFTAATGLPLVLVSAEEENWIPCRGDANESPFCEELNTKNHVCEACVVAAKRLKAKLPCEAPSRSVTCFAGLQETAVPIRLGQENFAFLKTGEVFTSPPDEHGFAKVIETLKPLGYSVDKLDRLRAAYFDTAVVDAPRYEGVVALLATFAEHLERQVQELLLVEDHSEPEPVRRAKEYIRANLEDPIHLPDVATHCGVSQHHFSRLFKSSTGLSFTEYVARCRVELAKQELLKANARVTEVAFEVGFQSLSQFTRSFARMVGMTPTQYRQQMLDKAAQAG